MFHITLAPVYSGIFSPILYADFETALTEVRASVAPKDLLFYEEWNKTFGSFR
jgi:hypothetical protein